jgi:cytoskeletal protein RodZ
MDIFKRKEIRSAKTLGEKLKKIREESKFSLDEATVATNVSKKYLEYLEEGRYEKLPGAVYIEQFLKKYAEFLNINPEQVISFYKNEAKIFTKLDPFDRKKYLPPKEKKLGLVLTPRLIRNSILILIIIIVLVYLGVEISRFISPPALTIFSPQDKITTNEKTISIQGKTEPESKVLINGKEILVSPSGEFEEVITLQKGINTIKIVASKKRSRENVVLREVSFE